MHHAIDVQYMYVLMYCRFNFRGLEINHKEHKKLVPSNFGNYYSYM